MESLLSETPEFEEPTIDSNSFDTFPASNRLEFTGGALLEPSDWPEEPQGVYNWSENVQEAVLDSSFFDFNAASESIPEEETAIDWDWSGLFLEASDWPVSCGSPEYEPRDWFETEEWY